MAISLNSARTQIIIVSFLAFACPGMFNALNGLGGAGASDPTVANNANTALYATFAVFGYFGGFIFDLAGTYANRLLMGLGGLTYVFYAVAQYAAGHNPNLGWLAILAGALLGIGAGLFWTAQGAQMMAYATENLKGTYIAIFWAIFNLGGFLGGLIVFGVNFNSVDSNGASAATYFTFAGIMALGSISAFFLLVNPNKVIREDGHPIVFERSESPWKALKRVALMFLDKRMLLLTPLFCASNFFYAYQFDFVNLALFSVRARGLNSAVYWASQMLGSYVLGRLFLDRTSIPRRKRAIWGGLILFIFFTIAWSMGAYLQFGYDISTPIDIVDSARYIYPIIVFLFYGIGDAMLQVYAYYIMGALTDDLTESADFVGYYKGMQSAAAAVAWALGNATSFGAQFIVNWVLFTISVPFYMVVAYKYVEDTLETAKGDAASQEAVVTETATVEAV